MTGINVRMATLARGQSTMGRTPTPSSLSPTHDPPGQSACIKTQPQENLTKAQGYRKSAGGKGRRGCAKSRCPSKGMKKNQISPSYPKPPRRPRPSSHHHNPPSTACRFEPHRTHTYLCSDGLRQGVIREGHQAARLAQHVCAVEEPRGGQGGPGRILWPVLPCGNRGGNTLHGETLQRHIRIRGRKWREAGG